LAATVRERSSILYAGCAGLLRAALGFYFSRIHRFHPERVPPHGPVLFASNHPNSLTDAFVIGASVHRKVNFVATVQLFRFAFLRWWLLRCGVIPINRVKDDPRGMRSVLSTFEACFKVLEQGEAVAIFPEGITHDDPQLKSVKTGAARMALELEHRHGGKLGLRIAPVGLSFSAKEKYRSEVLVNFGEPLAVADFLPGYAEKRHDCIQALNAALEHRIQELMLHLPRLERACLVEGVKRLYLDKLRLGNITVQEPVTALSEELLLTQAIAKAVDFCLEHHPERAADFARRLRHYEAALNKLRLPEELLVRFPNPGQLLRQALLWAGIAIFAAPVAAYGWLHRAIPYALVKTVVLKSQKMPRDKTHVSTAAIIAGLVIFTACYGACVLLCAHWFGSRAAAFYAASLPLASLAAHYYLRHLRRLAFSVRAVLILLRSPSAARRLLLWRGQLIAQIEAERREFLQATSATAVQS
jgi:1-acyl-sn-glycerol-3-phosphate acyltransferase